jgi:hypothetical protein
MTSVTNQMTQTNPTSPPPLLEITTRRAIALVRRWRWLSILMRVALILILGGAVYAYERGGGFLVMAGMFVLWTAVASLNARTRKLAFDAGQHFAAGEFDLAEDRLTQSLTSFTLAGSSKQMGLQQLALLRHAQSRWDDAAALARAFLSGRRRADARTDVPSRLVLAESLLEMGDLDAVSRELYELSRLRLNLRETLTLTQLRLDLLSRRGDFAGMFVQPHATVSLVELMPAPVAARCHAMLALAALRLGKPDWLGWLAARARLLGDLAPILETRPHLREAFPDTDPATA